MLLQDLFGTIRDCTNEGRDTVLATIVAEVGSSPRSAGSHMLVGAEGRISGTIGGGTLEYKAIEYAQLLLERGQSRRKTYRLHKNDEEELGMICGGDVEVYFQFIPGGDEKTAAFMDKCIKAMEKDEDLWLFTDLGSAGEVRMSLYGADYPLEGMDLSPEEIRALARNRGTMLDYSEAVHAVTGDRRIFAEPINFAGTVYIFGGGHCAQALQPVLSTVGFRCVVFDNRAEFVTRELFPTADGLFVGDYENIGEHIRPGKRDFIVIMTHAWDIAVLRQVFTPGGDFPCAYIGVICSRGKAAQVKQALKADGVSEEVIGRMNAPIGLPIKSETPEEIAISIAAEMIRRRAEARAEALGQR
jgi:xanthine dehydrogenase accessory factor